MLKLVPTESTQSPPDVFAELRTVSRAALAVQKRNMMRLATRDGTEVSPFEGADSAIIECYADNVRNGFAKPLTDC